MHRLSAEVCVIGGGPAGAVFARQAALLGHDVLLIDRASSQRSRIESVSPGARTLLESIGISLHGRAAGRPIYASLVRWSDAVPETIVFPTGATPILVDRQCFDDFLRTAAADAGVRVIRPAAVTRMHRPAMGLEVTFQEGQQQYVVGTRFVVHASGRSSRFTRLRDLSSCRVVALHGTWPSERAFDRGTILDRSSAGWCWGSSLSAGGGAQAIGFVPAERLRASRGIVDRAAVYRELIESMPLAAELMSRNGPESLEVRDAGAMAAADAIGEDFIRIGDASFTVDPLSSAGVQSAIQSAITGSIVVHTMLRQDRSTDLAIGFYQDARRRSIRHHRELAAMFYADGSRVPSSSDMARRGQGSPSAARPHRVRNTKVVLSHDTMFSDTPCIADDYVTMARGVCHPRLNGPVVFVDGIEIAPWLSTLTNATPMDAVMKTWADAFGTTRAQRLLNWVVDYGLLVPNGA